MWNDNITQAVAPGMCPIPSFSFHPFNVCSFPSSKQNYKTHL